MLCNAGLDGCRENSLKGKSRFPVIILKVASMSGNCRWTFHRGMGFPEDVKSTFTHIISPSYHYNDRLYVRFPQIEFISYDKFILCQ